jgi:hypothetical protein
LFRLLHEGSEKYSDGDPKGSYTSSDAWFSGFGRDESVRDRPGGGLDGRLSSEAPEATDEARFRRRGSGRESTGSAFPTSIVKNDKGNLGCDLPDLRNFS